MQTAVAQLYNKLCTVIQQHTPACLAVSGGLDSRLLSFLIATKKQTRTKQHHPHDNLFVHFSGPHVNPAESRAAAHWLQKLKVPFQLLTINPLDLEQVASNARDRCYHCKKMLFIALKEQAEARPGPPILMDGTNATDTTQYRPGLRALKELHVVSPFVQAGITKDMIHELAAYAGLPDPHQPASPCLLTRFPYDTVISPEALQQVMEQENILQQAGFRHFRVRMHPDGSLHIYAHPDNKACEHTTTLPIHWTRQISGYFDTA